MKLNKQTPLILALVLISGYACTPKVHLSDSRSIPFPDEAHQVITAQNQFGFRLFNLVNRADQTNSNKMISPLSIFMDLSMVYNGAAGQTRQAMKEALQLSNIDANMLNKTNQALLINLPGADPTVTIDMANSIWYKNNLDPLPSFLKVNQNYYQAEITGADFSAPQTVDRINNWVAKSTQQKITSILDHIEPSEVMFLLNAVYFNGKWTQSFDPAHTQKAAFHTAGQETKQVPFMYKESKYNYGQNDSLQVIELPYGSGSFSMYVLLPDENNKADALIASLNTTSFAQITSGMDSSKVRLYLPKWEADYAIDNLIPELTQMGMGIAFENNADFTRMYKSNQAQISQVVHKTYIKVDEEGTEAAAVTSTGMQTTALRPDYPPVMNVNRPFVYIITEKNSGSILFLGEVNDPS